MLVDTEHILHPEKRKYKFTNDGLYVKPEQIMTWSHSVETDLILSGRFILLKNVRG